MRNLKVIGDVFYKVKVCVIISYLGNYRVKFYIYIGLGDIFWNIYYVCVDIYILKWI